MIYADLCMGPCVLPSDGAPPDPGEVEHMENRINHANDDTEGKVWSSLQFATHRFRP